MILPSSSKKRGNDSHVPLRASTHAQAREAGRSALEALVGRYTKPWCGVGVRGGVTPHFFEKHRLVFS